jgi:MFS family permease
VGIFLVAVQAGLVAPVTERIGLARTLRGGLLLVSIGLVLLALSHSWWLLVPALALLVVGQGLVSPSLSASVADRAEEHRRGGALGTQQAAAALARVVGPACAGVLFHISVPLPYLVGAGLTLGALALAATTSSAEVDGSLPTGNL